MSFGAALGAMSALTEEATQLVVVADEPSELAEAARTRYSSGSVSIALSSAQARVFDYTGFELFTGRTAHDGRPTAYACRDFVCALPVFEVADLRP